MTTLSFTFNADDHELWESLDINSMLAFALNQHRNQIVEWLLYNNLPTQDLDEWWGLGSEFIHELGLKPGIEVDWCSVTLTIK